ncbi:malonyl-ACP O-methyltransferase BioC [Candidatus Nitrosacidococcus tergens]|uniref:Malonyl-[acyl-carrier protein] O-methyltransferase n=1 Tax=Candidatus Nitrosacidococcus tergens TaxID=553981 RepID=A0A7G1QAX5_9GAMM|nr:malonyl-ACP O-methyltransferase BioC [Candidatus Nitrosacidococcus tergens]CAB1276989.1 Malonyl-[acyl-carrier protein] O-methyltransferase [Candidatus Nitrosacidococcus tergens]
MDYTIDKKKVVKAFNQAAAHYDATAVLQKMVGEQLIERLDLEKLNPKLIVDLGAGTGLQAEVLHHRYQQSHIIALDFAFNMVQQAKKRFKNTLPQVFSKILGRLKSSSTLGAVYCVCGDLENLPLAPESVDVIFSNLALQWNWQLDSVFEEFKRILKPKGLLVFTTLGPDTLKELRESWVTVDEDQHVNTFMDMHDIGDKLVYRDFVNPVMDVERYILNYPDVYKLMKDLKNLGAHIVGSGRNKGLMGKNRQQKMIQYYESFRNPEGLPASFEVIFGHAWRRDLTGFKRIPRTTPKTLF